MQVLIAVYIFFKLMHDWITECLSFNWENGILAPTFTLISQLSPQKNP